MWATNIVVSYISVPIPSPRVSFVIPPVEMGLEEEQRNPGGDIAEEILINLVSVAHEVLIMLDQGTATMNSLLCFDDYNTMLMDQWYQHTKLKTNRK